MLAAAFAIQIQAQDSSNQDIIDRIKPVGQVHIAGAAAASAAAAGPRSGEDVYGSACIACHSIGVAGAPKKGNAGDWGPRMEKGMDAVLKNAINGIGGMPPRGTCGDCSDDEIKAAIEFMTAGI